MRTTIRSEAVRRRRRARWWNLGLLAGILVVLNVLASDLFMRVDLTARRIYSLSPASREMVRSLEDRLTIKAFFSRDLPAQYANQARYIRDKLDDYKAYGRGMVHFEFIDPGSEEDLRQQAAQYGIQPATIQVVERDKIEVKQIYMALVFLYENRTETIPLVQFTEGLEYDITTAIRRVSTRELPVVGFLAGHGMPTPQEGLANWARQLERHYQVREVSIRSHELIPPDVSILFIVGPRSGFSRWERYAIDQFILRGGKTGWLLDAVDADLQTSQHQGIAYPLELGMEGWLAHYGIRVRPALVMDQQSQNIQVMQSQGLFQVRSVIPYPFFPRTGHFNRDHPMVRDLSEVTFFYVSPLDTLLVYDERARAASTDTVTAWPTRPPDVRVEPLVFSSPNSGLQEEFFFIQPNPQMGRSAFRGGPFTLAATVSGSFRSAFEQAPAVPDTVQLPTHLAGPVENRLVVAGDGTFPRDEYLAQGNLPLLLNMVDWLNLDEALIQIRAKEQDHRPLRELSAGARATVKYLNILVPPLLALLAGLSWWRLRRARARTGGGKHDDLTTIREA